MKTIFIIAAIFAVFGYACCVVAGEEDEAAERALYQEDKRYSGLLEEDDE